MPLPTQPATLATLQAMQSLIVSGCLVGGTSPFTALSPADAARYGVANAVFVGQPKEVNTAYMPQCAITLPMDAEVVTLAGYAGRAVAEIEALVRVYVDPRLDWYAAEQQALAIRDALWPVLLRNAELGGSVASVIASEGRPGRGLCYEQIAGNVYRCYEARWWVRQQWSVAGGRAV